MPVSIDFITGFGFNLIVALILVRYIYYPATHNKPYVFTFITFNTVIYLVLRFITSIEMGIGVGFGLFAIFTILRYRTDPIPIREMTYLFVIAALPVMNSAGVGGGAWMELIAANLAVLAILYALEKEYGFHYEATKTITYEKIELIKPQNEGLLLKDLGDRMGLDIRRCVIGKVNFLRDTAEIKIYYEDPQRNHWTNGCEESTIHANGGMTEEESDM